jgi:hypothetical protein
MSGAKTALNEVPAMRMLNRARGGIGKIRSSRKTTRKEMMRPKTPETFLKFSELFL